MYCPNCGEKLRDTKHNFCPNCGSDISTIFETPQLRTKRDQYASPPPSQSTLKSPSPPIIHQKVIKEPSGGPGVYSKRCLAFSIICLSLTAPFWTNNLFIRLILPSNIPSVGLQIIRNVVIFITAVVGLIFGILAKTNSSKAGKLEPQNNLEKVGSILAIIGIVINAIQLGLTFFFPIVIIPI